jgi:hypothetical protein
MAIGKTVSDVIINIKGNAAGAMAAMATAEAGLYGFANVGKIVAAQLASSAAVATAGLSLLIGGAIALGYSIKNAVSASAEEQVVGQRTAALLASKGIAYEELAISIDKVLKKQEAMTTYNDTDLQTSLNNILRMNVSLADAYELNVVAANLAYTADINLVSASQLISKAISGRTSSIEQYGFDLEGLTEQEEIYQAILEQAPDVLAEASAGQNTMAGQMDQLSNQISNIAEAFGAEFLPMILGGTKKLTSFIIDNMDTIAVIMDIVAGSIKIVYANFKNGFTTIVVLTKLLIALGEAFMAVAAGSAGSVDGFKEYMKKSKETMLSIGDDVNSLRDTWKDAFDTMKGTNNTIIDSNTELKNSYDEATEAANNNAQDVLDNIAKLNEAFGDKSIEKQRQEYYNSLGVYVSSSGELLTGPAGAAGTVATEMTKEVDGKNKTYGVGRSAEDVMAEIYAKQEETKSTVGAKSDNGKVVIDSSEPVVVDTGFWSEGDGKNSKDLIETIQSIDHWVEKMANRPTASHFNIAASSTP